MISESDSKNKTRGAQSGQNPCIELIGPISDGMAGKKLSYLLGNFGENYLNEKEENLKSNSSGEANIEECSTTDCNSSGKETFIRNEHSSRNNLPSGNVDSILKSKTNIDNCAFTDNKSAFYRVPDVKKVNNTFPLGDSNSYDFFQTLYSEQAMNKGNKPVLFTSTKNKREKRNSQVNFQIIKTDGKQGALNMADDPNMNPNEMHESFINNNISLTTSFSKQISYSESTKNGIGASFCKGDYLEVLIIAAERLVERGELSEEIFNNSNSNLSNTSSNRFTGNATDKYDNSAVSSSNCEDEVTVRKCDNKACGFLGAKKSTLLWIKTKNFKGKNIWLCQGCFKAQKANQFCYYCHVIYRDGITSSCNDQKSWIQCDYCELWQHIECEEMKGTYTDIKRLNQDPYFKYMCPHCQGKHDKNGNKTNGKRKYTCKKDKKNLLGHKTRNSTENFDLSASKNTKKKCLEETKNNCSFNNVSISNSDSRDIYHDFYKISNINHNGNGR